MITIIYILLPDLKLEVLAELVRLDANDLLNVNQVEHFAFDL